MHAQRFVSGSTNQAVKAAAGRRKSADGARIETLERRELLSAAIAGVVLQDPTTVVTPPAAHHHVAKPKPQAVKLYIDKNANGILDKGDKLKATRNVKGQGPFVFKNVKFGHYMLASQTGTQPLTTYAIDVTDNKTYSGYIFGGPAGSPSTGNTAPTITNTGSNSNTNTNNTNSSIGAGNGSGTGTTPSNTNTNTNVPVLSNISYVLNGTTTVTTLTNNVHEGDVVTANFTVAAGQSVLLSLVSYHAPSAQFDASTADQQIVATSDTETFTAGTHSMTVKVPDCYFQVDFVYGTVIQHLGPAGTNNFYSPQGRLISNATGGDHACDCGCNLTNPDPAWITGRVYCDTNLNGTYDANVDEALAGQTVTLTGTDSSGQPVNMTVMTGADGTYTFNALQGTYTITETEPTGHVDAKMFAVAPAGNGTIAQNVGADTVSGVTLAANQKLTGYDFIEVEPGPISGSVWVDYNNDGNIDAGEPKLANVVIALTGTNDLGDAVSLTTKTDASGNYLFNVRPGNYTLTETQPAGYLQGKDIAGSLSGDISVQDTVKNIALPGCNGAATGYNFGEQPTPGSIAGRVFCDTDLSGAYSAGDEGLGGVAITLTGTTLAGTAVSLSTTSAVDGTYQFKQLMPGTYTVIEAEPAGHVDGKNFAAIGSAGGAASQASAAGPDTVAGLIISNGQNATGYNFAEVSPGAISGTVWLDCNNDGKQDPCELGIPNVTIKLAGTDDLGHAVTATATTDCTGKYNFANLRPGIYTITETQPAGLTEGKDILGSLGGDASVQDVFSNVKLPGCDGAGAGYNFGEQITCGTNVCHGDTATIGFWHNKNGQSLIKCVNGNENCTQLGDWLAATCPHLYSKFKGKSNSYIASYYLNCNFSVTGQKLDAQILGCALAVYVTNSGLCGNAGAACGFNVRSCGTAVQTINVGSCGAAFGCANNSTITVLQALCGADKQSTNGACYNGNASLCNQANSIFDLINQTGDIG